MAELLSQLPSDLDVENMVATALVADTRAHAPAEDPRALLLNVAGKGSKGIDNDDASSLADSDI